MGGPDEKKIYKSKSLSAKRARSDAKRSKRHDGKAKQQQVSCDPTPSRRIISSDRDSSSFNLVGPDGLFFGFFSANGPRTGEFV